MVSLLLLAKLTFMPWFMYIGNVVAGSSEGQHPFDGQSAPVDNYTQPVTITETVCSACPDLKQMFSDLFASSISGMSICVIGLFGAAVWYLWAEEEKEKQEKEKKKRKETEREETEREETERKERRKRREEEEEKELREWIERRWEEVEEEEEEEEREWNERWKRMEEENEKEEREWNERRKRWEEESEKEERERNERRKKREEREEREEKEQYASMRRMWEAEAEYMRAMTSRQSSCYLTAAQYKAICSFTVLLDRTSAFVSSFVGLTALTPHLFSYA
ncbi:hypothetical protein L211DRAFT_853266 [Terfezia boudieri ATCC MYA-4762]|uniref:Uncharacterized protein n=1 Tax=Terfezia boudieri ATCC MYA-4762 TaxID=1051890 RepID=A0A3N4L8W7_9PEZI|nr:hypothetical protein L211DRAFT_853266 [Terfezia boudieri ATCC MYA-4762]